MHFCYVRTDRSLIQVKEAHFEKEPAPDRERGPEMWEPNLSRSGFEAAARIQAVTPKEGMMRDREEQRGRFPPGRPRMTSYRLVGEWSLSEVKETIEQPIFSGSWLSRSGATDLHLTETRE